MSGRGPHLGLLAAADAAAATAAADAAAEEKPVAAKPKPEKKKPEPVAEEVQPAPTPGLPLLPIAGGLAVLAAAGAGFWFWRRKQAASPASVQAYAEEGHDAQVADDLAQLQDLNIGGGDGDAVGGADLRFENLEQRWREAPERRTTDALA